MTTQQYAAKMIEKYTRYISNINYHINNNNPSDDEVQVLTARKVCYEEAIDDFKIIAG